MGYGVKLLLRGEYALFSRPEMKVERVSYDVPTPSALIGILESIYWHPGVRYVIDKIHVLNPIAFVNIRRNEVSGKLSLGAVKKRLNGNGGDPVIYATEARTQRASFLLKDVAYGVEAHFEVEPDAPPELTKEKAYNMLLRRLQKGQHYRQPCFGCREFAAHAEHVEEIPLSPLRGDVDLGFMLYDLVFRKETVLEKSEQKGAPPTERVIYKDAAEPRFYRPHMVDGVIDVALYAKELLCS